MRIKVIKSEKDHKGALRTIERLWRARPGTPEGDILDVLVTLVEDYEAKKLEILPVPTSLAFDHLLLINSYLSSATAMGAISKMETDSVAGFSGMVILNDNLKKEDILIAEISQILTSHGL